LRPLEQQAKSNFSHIVVHATTPHLFILLWREYYMKTKPLNIFRYLGISMATIQINLKIPEKMYGLARSYSKEKGYRSMQELLLDCLRRRIYTDEAHEFVMLAQAEKMREVWDNDYDDAWEKA